MIESELTGIYGMIDISTLKPSDTTDTVGEMVSLALRYGFAAVFPLPGFISHSVKLLRDHGSLIPVGGVVGFPSGGQTTGIKVEETKAYIGEGCREIDMVINVGMLKSGENRYVEDEVSAVVQAAGSYPVKAILECFYLSDEEIRKGCEICCRAGVKYVKTGTGWAEGGATRENVSLMKSCVGEKAKIKAAGGVRGLDILLELYKCGAERFGVGLSSAKNITQQIEEREK